MPNPQDGKIVEADLGAIEPWANDEIKRLDEQFSAQSTQSYPRRKRRESSRFLIGFLTGALLAALFVLLVKS